MSALRPVVLSALLASIFVMPLPVLAADGSDGGISQNNTGADVSGGRGDDGTAVDPPGNGGKGGINQSVPSGPVGTVAANASGGDGGDADSGSLDPGGAGGAGGIIQIVTPYAVDGNIVANASGGNGGKAGLLGASGGGVGGAGGIVQIVTEAPTRGGIVADVSGGDGGDSSVPALDGAGGRGGSAQVVVISNLGEFGRGQSIFIDASGGSGATMGAGGIVQVSIGRDVVVPGSIVETGASMATLSVSGNVKGVKLYMRDEKLLASGATSGRIALSGSRGYSFEGFTVSADLKLIHKTSEWHPSAVSYLSCRPGTIIAIDQGGTIVFNAKNPDGGKFFHVGNLVNGAFASANPLGWTVAVSGKSAQIMDGKGTLVATCKLN